jgi:transcriptional regulator with XRE-family HTH domain
MIPIRRKCDEAGISLAELARRTGLSYTYVHALALGKRTNPGIKTLRRIASAIGCRVEDLI